LIACLLAFAVFVSVASAASNGTCDNVLFKNKTNEFWDSILFLKTPEPYEGSSLICRFHFALGDPQCCSDVVYDIIRNVWVRARTDIAIAVTIAHDVRNAWTTARDKFQPVRNDVDKAYAEGKISKLVHDSLIQFIDNVLAAWDQFIDNLIDDWADCMTMVLKYWAGVICLGCDPDWSKYIDEDGNGNIRLKLTVQTCNDIRSGCLPVWELVYNLTNNLEAAANQLREDFELSPVVYNGTQVCDGDCGEWLCDHFFAGKNAQTGALPSPSNNKRSSVDTEARFGHVEDVVAQVYSSHENGPKFVESFSDLLRTTNSAIDAFERVQRQSSDTGVQNDYVTSGGYNPVDVGAQSGLETNVNGSGSALTSWIQVLAALL